MVLAGLEDRGADFVALGVRPPHFEARRARHAVAQRAHLAARDGDVAHPEELDVRERAAVELLDHILGVRALDLVAVELAGDRLAHRARRRAVVVFGRDVIAAGLGVEFDPVGGRVAADVTELVLGEIEQDAVADHVAIVGAGRELLGLIDREILERVGREVREELQRVLAAHEQVDHVVRLVEQHAGLGPGALLVAPVGKFGRDDRVNVGADLRIAQHLDRIARGL